MATGAVARTIAGVSAQAQGGFTPIGIGDVLPTLVGLVVVAGILGCGVWIAVRAFGPGPRRPRPIPFVVPPPSAVPPPAGWYPDRLGNGMRWWNGVAWTDQTAPPPARSPYG